MPPANSKSASTDSAPEPDKACRPTFYMTAELLAAIDEQCATEGNKKRSPLVSEILQVVLTSPIGQALRSQAEANQHSVTEELKRNLILFNPAIPMEQIRALAATSHRNPDQMIVHLILLGLQAYEQG
jgi:metal-responsive CopG/Arc/MetJ family transcriptional regulator